VYKAGIIKCKKLYNYCEQCCDQVIPKLEKVLNYACWRGCIDEAKVIKNLYFRLPVNEKLKLD
jgi:hypothetical protein